MLLLVAGVHNEGDRYGVRKGLIWWDRNKWIRLVKKIKKLEIDPLNI